MDYTTASLVLSCPRKAFYARRLRLGNPTPSSAIRFGEAWHALHEARDQYDNGTLVAETLAKLHWQDPFDDYRTAAKLRLGYDRWLLQDHVSAMQVVKKEFAVNTPIGDGPEPYEGRVDALVQYDNATWVLDYKTTGRLDADWITLYRASNQFKWYYLAIAETTEGIAGVLVDLYHATKGTKSGKEPADREGNRFHLLPITYTAAQLAEARTEFTQASLLWKFMQENELYPKNTANCLQYGVSCPFLDLCDADPAVRERLQSAFPTDTFDPLQERT